jgi:RNA polymerase sigma-70 factor (ECF subfamily)
MMLERNRRALLQQVEIGDDQALGKLFDSEAPLLAARLRRRGASPFEVEDVLQETFLTVWTKAGDYRGDGSVAAWIWVIARNRWVSQQRKRGHDDVLDRLPETGVQFADPGTDIDMAAALAGLSESMRSVVEAVSMRGLTIEEASRELGLPEGTIKSRLHRARALLRKELS